MIISNLAFANSKTEISEEILSKLRYEVNKRTQDVSKSAIKWAWAVLFKQNKVGAKRLIEEIPDTIPAGDILLMPEGLIIGFDKEKYKSLKDLKIYDKKLGKLIFQKENIDDLLIIPKTFFEYNKTYIIKYKIISSRSERTVNETFHIMSFKEHELFEQEANKKLEGITDDNVKDFILAILYYDKGYDYNGNVKILKILNRNVKIKNSNQQIEI